MADINASDLLLIIIAFFLPPVTALLTDNCGAQFCLNVLLTILGFIPGLIHAIWLVYRQAKARDLSNARNGHSHGKPNHYVVVNQPGQPHGHGHVQPQQGYAPPPEAAFPAQPVQHQPHYQQQPQGYATGAKI